MPNTLGIENQISRIQVMRPKVGEDSNTDMIRNRGLNVKTTIKTK